MRRLVTTLCLLPTLVLAQELHTFKNGEVADAEKLNESPQYILNNASGGCSATQQDNSVLVECADGTYGVIAGGGTVVIMPEVSAAEIPDIASIPSGEFVWRDADGVLLAYYKSGAAGSGDYVKYLAQLYSPAVTFTLVNHHADQMVYLSSSETVVSYTESDCSGIGFTRANTRELIMLGPEEGLFIGANRVDDSTPSVDVLIRGQRSGAGTSSSTWPAPEAGDCYAIEPKPMISMVPIVAIEFPNEILNAAYPIEIDQLP